MSRRRLRLAAVVGSVVVALVGCSSAGSGGTSSDRSSAAASSSSASSSSAPSSGRSPASAGSGGVPRPDHVLLVIFENQDAGAVLGSPQAPYLTSLATAGASFTDAHGVTHPSQPNYLALFSGSTQGVTDDSCPLTFSAPNLAAQLFAAGRTFVGYSEDLPVPGSTVCRAGHYARKHVPWADFSGLPPSVNQPYTTFPTDLTQLPTVSFVVPNLCDDMHDCGVAAGDSWAKAHLPAYVDWARTHNSLLVVTFDEDEGTAGNHIATLLVGRMVRPGPNGQRIDHYSVLRTLEEMYGLAPIGAAATAQPISGVWTG